MLNDKRVIAIIPARGGSKGLPGKNFKELCGKPLIAWSIEKAKKSRLLDVVLVTTDSPEIADIACQYGADVPFLRPADLANDYATTVDVVRHALDYYQDRGEEKFDYIVMLEPTSPLRENDDVDKMLMSLDACSDEFDAIVSVGEVGGHPSILKRLTEGRMEPFCPELVQTTRRQDNVSAYFPYGVAYIVKTPTLLEEGTFYPRRCMPFVIKRYQNYEIDDIYDFLCVENVMKYEWGIE
jgi:CMP-N,N'-diacetyllegionaminic acid synthase